MRTRFRESARLTGKEHRGGGQRATDPIAPQTERKPGHKEGAERDARSRCTVGRGRRTLGGARGPGPGSGSRGAMRARRRARGAGGARTGAAVPGPEAPPPPGGMSGKGGDGGARVSAAGKSRPLTGRPGAQRPRGVSTGGGPARAGGAAPARPQGPGPAPRRPHALVPPEGLLGPSPAKHRGSAPHTCPGTSGPGARGGRGVVAKDPSSRKSSRFWLSGAGGRPLPAQAAAPSFPGYCSPTGGYEMALVATS